MRSPRTLRRLLSWAYHWWAARSLAVGAVATLFDVAVLVTCVRVLHLPNPVAAMVGVAFGSTLTFFANRHFAFRDHDPKLAPQAMKFVVATTVGMCVHGACVYVLADRFGVPVVVAKLLADIGVFSVGQLLLLRYVVFPRRVERSVSRAEPPYLRPPAKDRGPKVRRARPRRVRLRTPRET